MKTKFIFLLFAFLLFTCVCFAQTLAPGAPGKDAQWSSAGKQAIGTSASMESKVWFTLQNGSLTEVYYPDVTVANVHLLQFVVVNRKTGKIETEKDDTTQTIEVLSLNTDRNLPPAPKSSQNTEFYTSKFWFSPFQKTQNSPTSLMFLQTNWAKDKKWRIRKQYVTNPETNTVLIDFEFSTDFEIPAKDEFDVYVYYDPSINNTGMHDTAWTQSGTLMASDGNKVSALTSLNGFTKQTNGFYGTSDGLTQLLAKKELQVYDKAENGNVVQFAKLDFKIGISGSGRIYFNDELALSFGRNADEAINSARSSLKKRYQKTRDEYHQGWTDYVKTLPKVEAKYQAQFDMAAMVLKAQEDKTVRGANVASLTIPWGGGATANEDIGGGYHLVWSRDLYQVVTAYMALGDMAAANRALDFLFNIQQKPDGSFPQNSWLDGKQGWGSLQLDEVAYPLIMAYQLKRFDKNLYENHVKKAADFLVKTGPKTTQERWEEKSGYSPSTIAAEIAGLVCAADIAKRNGDETSATLYLKTADDWAANVEKWTATTNGKYGDGNYYVRLTENGKPDEREKTILSNNAGTAIENEIVDAGFLELVRLGIKSPDDPLIVKSVKVIDQTLRVNTPNGESFYRYTNDGYGEMDDGRRWNWDGKYTGKGRLWALLAGERGQYELALESFNRETLKGKLSISGRKVESKEFKIDKATKSQKSKSENQSSDNVSKAKSRLDAMANFANDGLMIPEQIWDKADVPKNIDKQFIPELKFGEGTGSATPLAWSMAQFIRLAVNLQAGRNLDTPDIVYNRYVLKSGQQSAVGSQPSEKMKDDCEKAREFRPKGNGTMTAPQKNDPSPRIFALKGEKESEMLFTYFGAEKSVEIAGDFTNWKPCGLKFQDFSNSKILVLKFPNAARVEYKLIVDGKWINDPLNPNKVDNGVGGENSFFTMPDYKPTVWDKELTFSPKYSQEEFEIDSKIFGKRIIKTYIPESKEALPVLYLQDGADYKNRALAVNQQINLVKAGKIKPFIMVFVDYKDRMKEYWASDDYAKFLATEVVPAIDAKYKTIRSRDGRAILGASLGGVTSVHAALKYPEIFGRVGGQSSSFWIDNGRVVRELNALDASKNKFVFYFDVGTLEGADDDRKAVEILRKKGYTVVYQEAETGHNWTSWRDRLADAFVVLLG